MFQELYNADYSGTEIIGLIPIAIVVLMIAIGAWKTYLQRGN